jgi:hypothetical protein
VTSAEIIVEFIRGRPVALAEMKKQMNDGFRAPELFASVARTLTFDALSVVSDEERTKLNRMRGNGDVDWQAVADAFKDTAKEPLP